MIFTRRFGALAARRNFPHIDETAQEPTLDFQHAEAELEAERAADQLAALTYAESK